MPRHQLTLVLDHQEPAVLDHADAVGELLGLFQVVRGEDHGGARGREPLHVCPEVAPQLDVDAGGRLVEEEHGRIVHQRLGDQQAPLHSSGERARVGGALVAQRQVAEDLVDAGIGQAHAEVSGLEAEGLLHGEERVEVDLLRHQPHGAAGEPVVAHHVAAEHFHTAFAGEGGSRHQADEGGLPGAVRAEQREDLAAMDVQVDVVERGKGAVALGSAAKAHRLKHQSAGCHKAGSGARQGDLA